MDYQTQVPRTFLQFCEHVSSNGTFNYAFENAWVLSDADLEFGAFIGGGEL